MKKLRSVTISTGGGGAGRSGEKIGNRANGKPKNKT